MIRSKLATIFLLLLFLIQSASAQAADPELLKLAVSPCNALNYKIYNGSACSSTASPVVYYLFEFAGEQYMCSGTLISRRFVLTAGHCLAGGADSITVKFGSHDIVADAYVVHPGYNPADAIKVYNDVALIRLSSDAPVQPMAIALSPVLKRLKSFNIFGYGLDRQGTYGILNGGAMFMRSVSSYFITGLYLRPGSNTCFGDSGGPATVTFRDKRRRLRTGIIGITSSGTRQDCEYGDRSYFTNIQSKSVMRFIRTYVPSVVTY